MPELGSGRFRWLFVCLIASPLAATAQSARSTPDPAFTFNPPPCQGNVFLDVNCSGQFDAWIEQYARDGITGGCGGGNYCPNSPVTRGQMAVFVEKAMRGASAWPANTVLVFAVLASDGSVDAEASGQALLDAVAGIPDAGPGAPSISNPWLVKLGPGTFDLGSEPLALPNFTTLEGAGSGDDSAAPALTKITGLGSAARTGTLVAPDFVVEVRDVLISNSGGAAFAIAVSSPDGGSVVLRRVFLSASGGTTSTFGLDSPGTGAFVSISDSVVAVSGPGVTDGVILGQNSEGSARIERTRIIVSPTGSIGTGIEVDGGLDFIDSHVSFVGLGPNTSTIGVAAGGGRVVRSNVGATCTGSGNATAVLSSGSAFRIDESNITASSGGCVTVALSDNTASLVVIGSSLSGGSIGLLGSSGSLIAVHRSTLSGAASAIDNPPGSTTRVGASQVAGPISNAGTLTCVVSYDGIFAPLICP
jgi:hypothetical protein